MKINSCQESGTSDKEKYTSYPYIQIPYRLTEEQIRKLTDLGMVWGSVHEVKWEKGFAEAAAYYAEHQNLNVPARYETESGYRLGTWIRNQRKSFRDGRLAAERVERLSDIHMVWNQQSKLAQNTVGTARDTFSLIQNE